MSYPCKFDRICKKFNPAPTLTVTVGVKGYPDSYRQIQKSNPCVNGGGCGCPTWRHYTNKEIGWYEPYNRPKSNTIIFNPNTEA